MRRVIAIAGVAFAALALAASWNAPSGASAAQDADNRAVVVVELPSGATRSACVLFKQPSITGLDLLRAAQMQPETYGFGEGQAVCKLCGEGCPASRSDCLSCDGGKYWQYYRSENGGGYVYSATGASSSSVTDGDVDGWSFASQRRTPLLVAVETVCSDPQRTFRFEGSGSTAPSTTAAPATTAPTTTSTAPSGGGATPTTAPAPARGAPPAARSTTTLAPPGAPTPSSAPPAVGAPVDGSTTTSTVSTGERAVGSGGGVGPSPAAESSAGETSLPAYLAFAGVLAAIVAVTVRNRRRRRLLA